MSFLVYLGRRKIILMNALLDKNGKRSREKMAATKDASREGADYGPGPS